MSNLNKLNGWTGDGGYTSRTSAQSYLASGSVNMISSGCGSSYGPKNGEGKPVPFACGAAESDNKPKTFTLLSQKLFPLMRLVKYKQ